MLNDNEISKSLNNVPKVKEDEVITKTGDIWLLGNLI